MRYISPNGNTGGSYEIHRKVTVLFVQFWTRTKDLLNLSSHGSHMIDHKETMLLGTVAPWAPW